MNIMIGLNAHDIKKAVEEYVERKMPLPHTVTGVHLNGPSSAIMGDCDDDLTATVTLTEGVEG